MSCKEHRYLGAGALWIVVGASVLTMFFHLRVVTAATLSEWVTRARQEGALEATVPTDMTPKTNPKLVASFKKRFGLDIKVNITPITGTRHYPKAAVQTRAGGRPTYDTLASSGKNNIQLEAIGGVQRIDGWKSLLAEINPLVGSGKVRPTQISPDPFNGSAFQFISRLKGLIYNSKVISKEDLPKTHAELGNSKYEGRWNQPPWTAHWDIGPLVFPDMPKNKWIAIVRKAGKNAGAVLYEAAGVQRVATGKFAFVIANTQYYLRILAKDPKAPLKITYFQDYNPVTGSYYVVRKRARHPAAATLFAMWMGTPEAKAIWQPDLRVTQFLWGESELDREVAQRLKVSGAKVISFIGNQEGAEFLRWIGTPEGRKYRKAVSQAIKGQ